MLTDDHYRPDGTCSDHGLHRRRPGGHTDANTGLYYADHRWYDPAVGRWISEDPLGFRGGDTNVTRYVGNNATNAVDPTGLDLLDTLAGWSPFKFGQPAFTPTPPVRVTPSPAPPTPPQTNYTNGRMTSFSGNPADCMDPNFSQNIAVAQTQCKGMAWQAGTFYVTAPLCCVATANKLWHIFGNPQHNLGPVLNGFGGNQQAAYQAVNAAAQAAATAGKLTGLFENVVTVKLD